MFADIMTPVVAMGVEVELVEGVGPVVAEPIRSAAAVERLRVPDPDEALAPVLEAIRLVRARARARAGRRRLLRRPLHRRRLPRRGPALARLRVTKALMYREPAVWQALLDKLAATFARLRARPGASRRRRRPALRLVGGRALARPTTPSSPRRASARVLAALARGGRARRSTSAPARRRCSPAMAAAGGDVIGLDWRIPLDDGLGARRRAAAASRATSTRRCCSGRGSGSRRPTRDVLARAGGPPGPHLQPRPRRPARHRPRRPRPAASSSSTPRRRAPPAGRTGRGGCRGAVSGRRRGLGAPAACVAPLRAARPLPSASVSL